eukprot:g3608.t1
MSFASSLSASNASLARMMRRPKEKNPSHSHRRKKKICRAYLICVLIFWICLWIFTVSTFESKETQTVQENAENAFPSQLRETLYYSRQKIDSLKEGGKDLENPFQDETTSIKYNENENVVECTKLRELYGILAGKSWGVADTDVQSRWLSMRCTSVLDGVGGGEEIMDRQEKKKVIVPVEELKVVAKCKQLKDLYGIVSSGHWGVASASTQKEWADLGCTFYQKFSSASFELALVLEKTRNSRCTFMKDKYGTELPAPLVRLWKNYNCGGTTERNDTSVEATFIRSAVSTTLHAVETRNSEEKLSRNDDASENIVLAICIATTSRGLKVENNRLDSLPLFKTLLPSIATTTDQGIEYWIYIAHDEDDSFFSTYISMNDIRNWFNQSMKPILDKRNILMRIVLVHFRNELKKPGPAFNFVTRCAFEDGADYIYRINDDTRFITGNWAKRAIEKLRSIQNVGVIGPLCDEGNSAILTHDMVHAPTHFGIFDLYYPPVFTDWWMDDWISHVYGIKRTKKGPHKVEHRISSTRYTINDNHKLMLEDEIYLGRDRVASWLSLHRPDILEIDQHDEEVRKEKVRLAQGENRLWCISTRKEYKVIPGTSWGTLSVKMQRLWSQRQCNKHLLELGIDGYNERKGKEKLDENSEPYVQSSTLYTINENNKKEFGEIEQQLPGVSVFTGLRTFQVEQGNSFRNGRRGKDMVISRVTQEETNVLQGWRKCDIYDTIGTQCNDLHKKYGIRVGGASSSWGRAPSMLRKKWSQLGCNFYSNFCNAKQVLDTIVNENRDPIQICKKLASECFIFSRIDVYFNMPKVLRASFLHTFKCFENLIFFRNENNAKENYLSNPKHVIDKALQSRSINQRNDKKKNPNIISVPHVAICIPTTTRNVKEIEKYYNIPKARRNIFLHELFEYLDLFATLLPSFVKTAQAQFTYSLYIVHDDDDQFYAENSEAIKEWIHLHVIEHLKRRSVITELYILSFKNDLHKPGPVFNFVTAAAYEDGADYIYRINDDTKLIGQRWTQEAIQQLRSLDNIGVVGPICKQGKQNILTHDFVHRSHLEIFDGIYYPPILMDWWMDDWISTVYGKSRTRKGPFSVIHRADEHSRRYEVNLSHRENLDIEVQKGKQKIKKWISDNENRIAKEEGEEERSSSVVVWCHEMMRDHHVIIGRSWGSLSLIQRDQWNTFDCDALLHNI